MHEYVSGVCTISRLNCGLAKFATASADRDRVLRCRPKGFNISLACKKMEQVAAVAFGVFDACFKMFLEGLCCF
jgi:hypothetical protein